MLLLQRRMFHKHRPQTAHTLQPWCCRRPISSTNTTTPCSCCSCSSSNHRLRRPKLAVAVPATGIHRSIPADTHSVCQACCHGTQGHTIQGLAQLRLHHIHRAAGAALAVEVPAPAVEAPKPARDCCTVARACSHLCGTSRNTRARLLRLLAVCTRKSHKRLWCSVSFGQRRAPVRK